MSATMGRGRLQWELSAPLDLIFTNADGTERRIKYRRSEYVDGAFLVTTADGERLRFQIDTAAEAEAGKE